MHIIIFKLCDCFKCLIVTCSLLNQAYALFLKNLIAFVYSIVVYVYPKGFNNYSCKLSPVISVKQGQQVSVYILIHSESMLLIGMALVSSSWSLL